MAEAVYMLCAVASLACAVLLIRGYCRSRTRLLLWSGLCFVGLAANSILVCIDLMVFPALDLRVWRPVASLAGMAFLVYGLVWETGGARGVAR